MRNKVIRSAALMLAVSATALADDTASSSPTSSLVQLKCQTGQIPKFDGVAWKCASDQVAAANGPTFVLKAADGGVIGSVISVSRTEGYLRATAIVQFDTQDGTKRVALEAVNNEDFSPGVNPIARFRQSSVSFSEAGCGGVPYLFPVSGFPNALWPVAVNVATDGSGLRRLYIATSQIPETRQIRSFASTNPAGTCTDQTFDALVVPAELVEGDLDAVYPPSFRLEFAP